MSVIDLFKRIVGISDNQDFPTVMGNFIKFYHRRNVKKVDNLNVMLKFLTKLKIRSGYELDAFMNGSQRDFCYQIYVCKRKSKLRWKPSADSCRYPTIKPAISYNDSMYIEGHLPCWLAEQIPHALNYFQVEHSELGIIHAWLLHNMSHFMGGGGHYFNVIRSYIYNHETFEDCKKYVNSDTAQWVKLNSLNVSDLLPKIQFDGKQAIIECYYWVLTSGLVKEQQIATYNDGKVVFSDPSLEWVLQYDSGLRFC